MGNYKLNPFTGDFDRIAYTEQENCLLSLSADQTNINANTVINLLDNASSAVNNNITFNNITHRATLSAGKTYKLQAATRHKGSTGNTAANYQWYDVTNSAWLGKPNQVASLDAPTWDSYQSLASAIVTPSTTIEVELRCLSVSFANQGLRQDSTYAIIEKIKEDVYNTIFIPSIEEENCLLALGANQDNLNNNDTINLLDNATKAINNNVNFNNVTHRVTLSENKTYKLLAWVRLNGISTGASMNMQWYDVTNSIWLGYESTCSANDNGSDDGSQECAGAIVSPSSNIEVELRVKSSQQANNGVITDSTFATIEKISERALSQATVEKEWTVFTPSIEAITTNPTLATTHKKRASYKVVGKSLHIIWSYSHIFATGATVGSGDYLIPIPAGYTIDTSKVDLASVENTYAYGTPVGNGHAMQDGAERNLELVVYDGTRLKLIAGTKFSSPGWFSINVNNHKIMFTAEIPIL
jgi:hypothetical protein